MLHNIEIIKVMLRLFLTSKLQVFNPLLTETPKTDTFASCGVSSGSALDKIDIQRKKCNILFGNYNL